METTIDLEKEKQDLDHFKEITKEYFAMRENYSNKILKLVFGVDTPNPVEDILQPFQTEFKP